MMTTINKEQASQIVSAMLAVRQTQVLDLVDKEVWDYIEANKLMHTTYWPSKAIQITARGNKFIQEWGSRPA